MRDIRGTVLDSLGRPINQCLVRVYVAGSGTLATLWADEAQSVPVVNDGVTSPLTEADGSYGPFYPANGEYDIKYLKSGYTFDDTDTANLRVFDPQRSGAAAEITSSGVGGNVQAELNDKPGATGTAKTVVTVHTFNPAAPGPAFALGANAQNQRIVGMAADKNWDGVALREPSVANLEDHKVISARDDFLGGSPTSGSVGKFGWIVSTALLSTTTFGGKTGLRADTTAVSANAAYIALAGPTSANGMLNLSYKFKNILRSRMATITSIKAVIGLRLAVLADADHAAHAEGAYFYADVGVSGNWKAITRASSTNTETDTGIAIDTSVHDFKIERRTSAIDGVDDVRFYVDGSLVATHTTNLPTAYNAPQVVVETTTAAARSIDLFMWGWYQLVD